METKYTVIKNLYLASLNCLYALLGSIKASLSSACLALYYFTLCVCAHIHVQGHTINLFDPEVTQAVTRATFLPTLAH